MNFKSFFIFLVCISALSVNAQNLPRYAVIIINTNPNLENFDCETDKQIKLVSGVTYMEHLSEMTKTNIKNQFYDYLYDNEKGKLSQVTGLTNYYFATIINGKTESEALEKAKRYGAYNEKTSACGIYDNDYYTVYVFNDFKYDPNNTISQERVNALRAFIDPKN